MEAADDLAIGVESEDIAIGVEGDIEAGTDGAIDAGAFGELHIGDEHIGSGDGAFEGAVGVVDIDAGEAFFAGDEFTGVGEGEVDGVTAAAEAVDFHAGFTPGGDEASIERIGFDAEEAGIGDAELVIAGDGDGEIGAGDIEAGVAEVGVFFTEAVLDFAGLEVGDDDFAIAGIGEVERVLVGGGAGEVGTVTEAGGFEPGFSVGIEDGVAVGKSDEESFGVEREQAMGAALEGEGVEVVPGGLEECEGVRAGDGDAVGGPEGEAFDLFEAGVEFAGVLVEEEAGVGILKFTDVVDEAAVGFGRDSTGAGARVGDTGDHPAGCCTGRHEHAAKEAASTPLFISRIHVGWRVRKSQKLMRF